MLQTVRIKAGEEIHISSGIYQIECEIGSGGFGTVFKGYREGNPYAIKLNRMWELLPGDREDLRRRIQLEFKISNTIFSENIVHTYSYDEIFENPVLVMDYCPDGNLRKKIGKHFDQNELYKLLLQILGGLNILHSYQIIHRDIKPENILFKNNIALITDFGISANLKERVTQRNILGQALKIFATLSYSAPEQSQKNMAYKSTGPTNDLFSFGVMLYEIITEGKLPFGEVNNLEEDSGKIQERKVNGNWDKKTLKKFTDNKTLIEIVNGCLLPEPDMRFQSTNEIFQKLHEIKSHSERKDPVWKFMIKEGFDAGKVYNLTNLSNFKKKLMLTIGRLDENCSLLNDIPLREASGHYISLHHGTLECILKGEIHIWCLRDGQWYNRDGKVGWYRSTNGIKVNGKTINQFGSELQHNDQIKIGQTIIEVKCE